MPRKPNKHIKDDGELQMTPMIDIVFQLLIFFLLSAKFIALEGQLSSYLPKDKGLSSSPAQLDLVNVTFELDWTGGDEDGRVVCRTFDYRAPGDRRENVYEFGTVDAREEDVRYGPNGGKLVSFRNNDLGGRLPPVRRPFQIRRRSRVGHPALGSRRFD
ncbi:MAG: biopolymer transporter ExbD, partial [Planctomycetota bacterium]